MTGACWNPATPRLAPQRLRTPGGSCRRARRPSLDLPSFALDWRPPRERDFRPSQAPARRSRLRTGGSGCDSWSQSLSAKQRTGCMKSVSRPLMPRFAGQAPRASPNRFVCSRLARSTTCSSDSEDAAEILRIPAGWRAGGPFRGVRRGVFGGKRGWCPGADSNHRHPDFQSGALPTELPGRTGMTF